MSRIISEQEKIEFSSTNKIGLLSTVGPDNMPHITLISSISAKSEDELMWGEFTHGLSKIYIKDNPKTGFLIINEARVFWRGTADHYDTAVTGEDIEMYNNQPLFRYNSYLGIGVVHYMKLKNLLGGNKLPMKGIIKGALLGRLFKKSITPSLDGGTKLNHVAAGLANDISSLKFLSYLDDNGYPVIVPVIQAAVRDGGRIFIPLTAFAEELSKIAPGSKAALYVCNLKLESVLLQGVFCGIEKKSGIKAAIFDIEKVYNSMLPVVGYCTDEPYKLVH